MEQKDKKASAEASISYTGNTDTYTGNTDNREAYDYETKYPKKIRREICLESLYLFVIMLVALTFLFLNVFGFTSKWLSLEGSRAVVLEYYLTFSFAGLLGGILFGMKYFYRVVARGYWHQDRRYWRLMSPFISLIIALVIGAMSSSGLLNVQENSKLGWQLSIGFFAGYFADEAVGKMYEVASVVFGKSAKGDKDDIGKSK